MKKFILSILIITIISCERDDICIDPTTPNLIVVFYDKTNQTERKDVPSLTIEVDSLGTFVPINRIALDSITIPLRVDEDITKIRLSRTETGATNEFFFNFTLEYQRDEVFVSKPCGFKTTYTEITEEITEEQWNATMTINNINITDETAKHISIFH